MPQKILQDKEITWKGGKRTMKGNIKKNEKAESIDWNGRPRTNKMATKRIGTGNA